MMMAYLTGYEDDIVIVTMSAMIVVAYILGYSVGKNKRVKPGPPVKGDF